MKPFLKMNTIDMCRTRSGVFTNKGFFQKLFLSTLVFSSVFSAHFFYGEHSPETLSLGGATIVFASEDAASSKEGAGHQALLNINKASSDELIALPGIGPKLAELILKYRETNGPFQDENALLKVKGIGQKKLDKISPFLQFESLNK